MRWTLVEARYHFECHRNFTSSTRQHTPHKIQRGHPVSVVAQSAFDDLCDELLAFGKNELFTVANLHEKLTMLAIGIVMEHRIMTFIVCSICETNSEKFKDLIYFATHAGGNDVRLPWPCKLYFE